MALALITSVQSYFKKGRIVAILTALKLFLMHVYKSTRNINISVIKILLLEYADVEQEQVGHALRLKIIDMDTHVLVWLVMTPNSRYFNQI